MILSKISPYVYPGIKDTADYVKVKKFDRDKISKEEILLIVSEHCSVSSTRILTRIRKREVVDARHMYIAVMRKIFKYPVTEIFVHTSEIRGREHFFADYYEKPETNFIDVDTTNKTIEESLALIPYNKKK